MPELTVAEKESLLRIHPNRFMSRVLSLSIHEVIDLAGKYQIEDVSTMLNTEIAYEVYKVELRNYARNVNRKIIASFIIAMTLLVLITAGCRFTQSYDVLPYAMLSIMICLVTYDTKLYLSLRKNLSS